MRWVPVLLFCVAAKLLAGQDAQSPAAVRIDAVVTDRTGRPLLDLKTADFELRADGAAQAIEHVELRRTVRSPAAAAGRTVTLLFDDYHVTRGASSERARNALLRFVDEHVRPADRVAVVKPLDTQADIEPTGDRALLRRAIALFEGRAGDFAPRTPFEEQYLGRAPDVVAAARAHIVTAALTTLVTRLGGQSWERRAIAVVSEGFAGEERTDGERRPDFTSIVRAASRSGVAIYALDPSDRADGERQAVADRMRRLAADTGGEAASGDQIGPALARMARDLDSYYILTFTPADRTEGSFRRLELRSRRRGAFVRARAGYWTPVSASLFASLDSAPRRVRALRRSVLIQSWFGLTRLSDGRMRLRVAWELAGRMPRDPRPAPQAVAVRAARPDGEALLNGTIGAGQLAEVIVEAGRVELDLTILAADGSTLDREARDLDVPEPDGPRVALLPPEIIRARTLREFQTASVDPRATPTPARVFRRSDRLLVRAPAMRSDATRFSVSARLLNRWGQPMRALDRLDAGDTGIVQFQLPLAWLMPGEYEIELRTRQAGIETSQKIPVRVTG